MSDKPVIVVVDGMDITAAALIAELDRHGFEVVKQSAMGKTESIQFTTEETRMRNSRISILPLMAAAALGALGTAGAAVQSAASKIMHKPAEPHGTSYSGGEVGRLYRAHSPGAGSSNAAERRKALKKRNRAKNKRAHRGRRG